MQYYVKYWFILIIVVGVVITALLETKKRSKKFRDMLIVFGGAWDQLPHKYINRLYDINFCPKRQRSLVESLKAKTVQRKRYRNFGPAEGPKSHRVLRQKQVFFFYLA